MLANIKNAKQIRREIDRLEEVADVDHLDAEEKVLPFMPQYINPELHSIFNDKEEKDGGSQNIIQSVTEILVAEGSSL